MEFRVEITDVTAGCDVFFKLSFLQNKVRLSEHEVAATAVSAARCTFEAMALSLEPIFRPQAPLSNDDLHAFEPAWGCRVGDGKVKVLRGPCMCAVLHLWAIFMVSPALVWLFRHLPGRHHIASLLLVTGCIVKHEQASCEAICLPLEDVNGAIDLF